ncbi:MAG: hypothetical protein GY765_22605, partial [bacterium]|nr:hypothetical protein [bacterium]
KEKKKRFLNTFRVTARVFNSLSGALKDGDVDKAAKKIIKAFASQEDSKEILGIIVRGSLRNYQAAFFKTATEKQLMQLTLLLQGELGEMLRKTSPGLAGTDRDLAAATQPGKPKQIKILSITAAPEAEKNDDLFINYEHEQRTAPFYFINWEYCTRTLAIMMRH